MAFLLSHYAMVALFGWTGVHLLRATKSKKKKTAPKSPSVDLPSVDACGHFVWKAGDVDAAIQPALDEGERDAETLALLAAKAVYASKPDGTPQIWPAAATDEPAICIYDWIMEHVSKRLGELDNPEKPKPTQDPKRPTQPQRPAPVDLELWTDPGNYPTPRTFHQVGGDHSAKTIQGIARMALTTAFFLALNDLDRAKELAKKRENWEYYREAINCVPWNHALFGSKSKPESNGYYPTQHGDSISMFPVHANVADQLARGDAPTRRVRTNSRGLPGGGKQAFMWLPGLDEDELREGRVVLTKEVWANGESAVNPPPEVTVLGIANLPVGRTWGCFGHQRTTEELEPRG